jgi:hypothetical protein
MSGKLRIQNEGEIQFGQWSTSGTGPANPSAGYVTLYSQGSQLKAKDSSGNIQFFGSSGTAGTSGQSGSSGTSGQSGSSGTSGQSGSSGSSGTSGTGSPGTSGTSGQDGSSGSSGVNGSSGSSGQSGTSGSSGQSGSAGTSGSSGISGSSGTSGQTGSSGSSGSSGVDGSSGTSGSSGESGTSGSSGSTGTSGSSGESGTSGSSGSSGVDGSSGTSGQDGSSGTSGQDGSSGSSGNSGSSGSSGVSGSSGTSGVSGQSTSLFPYNARTNLQSGNPGNTNIIWNNATQTSATQINISHLDRNNIDIDVFLALIQSGSTIIIQDANDSANYQRWTFGTGVEAAPNSYWEFPATYIDGGYSFTNGHNILVIIAQQPVTTSGTSGSSGTSGANGATGATGAATTINNNADNRVITGSATPDTLEGETALTFDGSQLSVNGIRIGLGAGSIATNIKIGNDGSLAANTTGSNNLVISTQPSLPANLTGSNNIIFNAGATGVFSLATLAQGNNVQGSNIFPVSTRSFTNNTINGNNIGTNATAGNVVGSIIIGNNSLTRGATASSAIMIGSVQAVATGSNVTQSQLIGLGIGENFAGTGATFSQMTVMGHFAMNNVSSGHATGSVVLGLSAVGGATNVRLSNSFIAGQSVAAGASGATFTNAVVIGSSAARNITGTNVSQANIIGHQVAQNAVNANFDSANLIGQNIGQNASGASFSAAIAIGQNVAQSATGATFSNAVLLGPNVAQNSSGTNYSGSVLIGNSVLSNNTATNNSSAVLIGNNVGANSATGTFQNAVFIGESSGSNANLDNANSFVLGVSSAKFGGQRTSVVIGSFAHQGVTGSQLQNNIAIGQNAGVLNNSDQNIFIGPSTAQNLTGGSGKHTIIGHGSGGGLTGGTANTIIGANVLGLTGTLSNNILLADGDGNVRIKVDGATAAYINTPLVPKKDSAVNIEAIASPVSGMVMYDTTNNTLDLYNGTAWQAVSTATDYGYFAYTDATMAINFTAKGITMASQSANGITVASNTRLTFGKAGTYRITTSHFPGTDYAQELWLKKNGSTNITGTSTQLSGNGSTVYSQASWDYVAAFSASDYVEVIIAGVTGTFSSPSQNRSGNPGGYITRVVITQLA